MESGSVAGLLPAGTIAAGELPTAARAYHSVEVHASVETVAAAWAELEAAAPCSIYQTRRWLMPWLATLGRRAGITPWLVLARGAGGRPVGLLLLGLRRVGPCTVAAWLGGRDANAGMALLAPEVPWSGADIMRLLMEAARTAPRRPDAFMLTNQPFRWNGHANPLASLPHAASPSAAYGLRLPSDARTLFEAKFSKETAKKLRKKEAKLATLGTLTYRVAGTATERSTVLDAFLAQKTRRLRAKHTRSEFDAPEMRAFIEAASASDGVGEGTAGRGAAGIELHALMVDERVVAVYGGAAHRGGWSGMFNAFDAEDEAVARCSPGDLLLMRVVARACADGLTHFDLGIGEARYKAALCETIPLFDTVVTVTLKGRVLAALLTAARAAKGRIKRHGRLLALARRLDAMRGPSAAAPDSKTPTR